MTIWWWLAGGLAAVAALAGAARWYYSVITVHGTSMEPGLKAGERLLVRRCGIRRLRRGKLVIFREPGRRNGPHRPAWLTAANRDLWVVKRVAGLPGDAVPDAVRPAAGTPVVPPRAIVVLSDNPEGRDSRQWGAVRARDILGAPVSVLPGDRAASRGRGAASRRRVSSRAVP